MLESRADEKSLSDVFLQAVYKIHDGEKIKECIQCGTCSASCPTSSAMDYPPREIIAALRAGMLERVLRSNTIWLCASCYSCYVRCPSGIKITDMMYELKRLAIDYDLVPKDAKAPVMAKLFVDMVDKNGRTAELPLVSSYMLKTDPLGAVKMLPRAIKMFRHGRMSFTSHKIKGVSDLRKFTGTINEEFAPTQQRSTAMGEAN